MFEVLFIVAVYFSPRYEDVNKFEQKFNPSMQIEKLTIDNEMFVLYEKINRLKTISVIRINDLNLKDLNRKIAKANTSIRSQLINNGNSTRPKTKRNIKINLIYYTGSYDFERIEKVIKALNPEEKFSKRRMNVIYIEKINIFVFKTFNKNYLYVPISRFFGYKSCLKLICKFLNINFSALTYNM